VTLEYSPQGGHVGFIQGRFAVNLNWLPQRILRFFESAD
jgi:predicted alpha/beta-fold hydrolase